jgi:hypothetical protein
MGTGAGECGEMRRALGVYVLGAIDPADRKAVDQHLARCPTCRDELTGLTALPAMLSKVPVSEADRLLLSDDGPTPEGALARSRPARHVSRSTTFRAGRHPSRNTRARPARHLSRSMKASGRRWRRWRDGAILAAAVLVACAGAVTASRALYPPTVRPGAEATPWAATVSGSNQRTHAGLTVRYTPQAWGLKLEAQVSGIPVGTRCELLVMNSRGQRVPAGSWTIAPREELAWYPASSSVRASAAASFVVTTAGRALVSARERW